MNKQNNIKIKILKKTNITEPEYYKKATIPGVTI